MRGMRRPTRERKLVIYESVVILEDVIPARLNGTGIILVSWINHKQNALEVFRHTILDTNPIAHTFARFVFYSLYVILRSNPLSISCLITTILCCALSRDVLAHSKYQNNPRRLL
jgi:hypothetical protein